VKKGQFLVLVFTLLFSIKSYSIDFEDAVFPELATSARALAMGNAFICKTDDAASVWYNPAGLGTVRKTHFHLSNFQIEANKGWFRNGTDGSSSDAASNFSKGLSLEGSRELAVDSPGVISSRRIQAMPNFTTRFLSLGYLYSKNNAYIF
jgi:hypothetical protein